MPMQDFVGKHIDRYRVTDRLGVGGMAVVYKAYDTRLEREVAIKLIRTEAIPPEQYERLMKRFEREAKAQARFNHRHIMPVHDYGEVDSAPYLVMAYTPGDTLKARAGKPIPYQQALRWLIPIADALAYAHDLGVIHRDVKPSNILFDEQEQPILTDFGIAKLLETDEATLTGTGMGVGTPEYMAPEQWRGQATPATDQYALGVVLYELLTGHKPYTADTPAAVAIMQAMEPLQPPGNLVAGIPGSLEKLLYKALALRPEDRYEDMNALSNTLKYHLKHVEWVETIKHDLPETLDYSQRGWNDEDDDATRDDYQEKGLPREIRESGLSTQPDLEVETFDLPELKPPKSISLQRSPAIKSKREKKIQNRISLLRLTSSGRPVKIFVHKKTNDSKHNKKKSN